MQQDYKKLRESAQKEVCEEFQTIYPDSEITLIHSCFMELNPVVEWDEQTENAPYNIWEVWKPKFEKLLALKKQSKLQSMYFLTKTRFKAEFIEEQIELIQLVQASDKEKARAAVQKDWDKNNTNNQFVLLEIRVDDTLIGE